MHTPENENHFYSSARSDALYVLKATAIISAVAAHCVGYTAPLAQQMSTLLGTIGVPVFFLLSGLFFRRNQPQFWRKKARTVIVPWLVWGTITYLASCIAAGSVPNFIGAIQWTFGYLTWLYFVPVLLICFALFRVCASDKWTWLLISLWAISNALTIAGIWRELGGLTVYQNAFNWVGFFAIGVLLQKAEEKQWLGLTRRLKFVCIILTLFLGIFYLTWIQPSYWTPLSIPFELLSGLSLYFFAESFRKNSLLKGIGKNTYPIFFAHMQFGINLADVLIFNRLFLFAGLLEYVIVFLRPFIVVIITYGLLLLGQLVAKKLHLTFLLGLLGMERGVKKP